MRINTKLKDLYETDDNLWLAETIELLKQKRFDGTQMNADKK